MFVVYPLLQVLLLGKYKDITDPATGRVKTDFKNSSSNVNGFVGEE